MTLPRELRALFLDVGGPLYDDANYMAAVVAALDELRAERGRGPVDRAEVRRVYDAVRARQGGSLRTALATELLGDPALRTELHERTRRHWTHPPGTLYPDVLPLLRALTGRVVVGVLANQEPSVVEALTRDGVAPFVDVWGVSAIVGHEKPSPELFSCAWSRPAARRGRPSTSATGWTPTSVRRPRWAWAPCGSCAARPPTSRPPSSWPSPTSRCATSAGWPTSCCR
jgi:FMN phosphatase YigB (HAD superfamily)